MSAYYVPSGQVGNVSTNPIPVFIIDVTLFETALNLLLTLVGQLLIAIDQLKVNLAFFCACLGSPVMNDSGRNTSPDREVLVAT